MRFLNTLQEPPTIRLADVIQKKGEFEKIARQFGLVLIFVHGSLAQDRLGPLSDLDFAVLGKDKEPLTLKTFLQIIEALQLLVGREDIDLVDLANAPPLLKMEVIRKGQPLYEEEGPLTHFRHATMIHFLDTQALRDSLSYSLREVCLGSGT